MWALRGPDSALVRDGLLLDSSMLPVREQTVGRENVLCLWREASGAALCPAYADPAPHADGTTTVPVPRLQYCPPGLGDAGPHAR
jgi:hypothetical protein